MTIEYETKLESREKAGCSCTFPIPFLESASAFGYSVTDVNGDYNIPVPPYRYHLVIQTPSGAWKLKLGFV